MVAYPRFIASYTVPVRQYRILQSRFLQRMGHPKPPCDLLILQGLTLAYKGLPAFGRQVTLWKICTPVVCSVKFICIFKLFPELTTSVCAHAHAGHTRAGSLNAGFVGKESGCG